MHAGLCVVVCLGTFRCRSRRLPLLSSPNPCSFVQPNPCATSTPTTNEKAAAWSETGDRYLLKLFRDFVFHDCDPTDGAPRLDWGHVVEALNKLDAGSSEELLLLSRDEQSMLVASYGDVRVRRDAARGGEREESGGREKREARDMNAIYARAASTLQQTHAHPQRQTQRNTTTKQRCVESAYAELKAMASRSGGR